MIDPIRILILDDSPDDFELIKSSLDQQGISAECNRVEDRESFIRELDSNPDLVFLDYTLSMFDGWSALKIIREKRLDTPSIFISGTYGDDVLAGAMDLGADDFLLKDRLERLGASVRRALGEKKLRDEKRRSQSALRESERQMRSMLENLHMIAIMLDLDGKVTFCNDYLLDLTGWEKTEVIRKDWFEMFLPEEWDHVRPLLLDSLQKGEILAHYENPIKTRAGENRFVKWNNTVLLGVNGEVIGTASIGEDVTDQRKAEEAVRRIEEKYKLVLENSMDAYFLTAPDGRIFSANKAARDLFGYSEQELIEGGRGLIIDSSDPRLLPSLDERKRIGKFQGELTFIKKGGIKFPAEVSSFIFFDDGQEYTSTAVHDISKRKLAEEEQRKLSRAVEHSPASIVITDIDAAIEYVNPRFTEITGYTLDEVVGKNPRILQSGLTPKVLYPQLWETIKSGKEWRGEFTNRKKNGEIYWEAASISPIMDAAGQITHFVAVKEDITERKAAEERLRESEEKFFKAFHVGPAGMAITRLSDGKFLDANQTFLDLLEFSRDEAVGHTFTELNIFTPEERQKLAQHQREQGGVKNFEITAQAKSGRTINLLFSTEIMDINGEPCLLSILNDVTNKKQAEELMTQYIRRLERSEAQAGLGSWEFDQVTGKGWWSRQMYHLLGFPEPEHEFQEAPSFDEYLLHIHEDDRERIQNELSIMAAGNMPKPFEYRTNPEFGTERQLIPDYVVEKDDADGVIRFSGTLLDITERKKAERQFQESETRFRSLVEHSSDEFAILSPDGTLLYESPTANPTLGYRPGKFVGKNLFQLVHHDDLGYVQSKFKELVDNPNLQLREQFRLKHQDGSWTWVEAVVTNLANEPSVGGIVVNFHNITDRKNAEAALAIAEKDYRSIFENAPVGIFQSTPGGRFIRVNSAMAKMYGYDSPDDMVESVHNIVEQIYVNPEDRFKFQKMLAERGELFELENQNLHKDGTAFWTSTNARVVTDREQNTLYYEGFIRDITERKQAGDSLQQQNKYLSALQDATRAVLQEVHVDKVLETILVQAANLVGTDHGYIYQVQSDDSQLIVTFGTGIYEKFIGNTLERGEGLAGKIWESGKPLVVPDYVTWDGHSSQYANIGLHALMGVPLFSDTRVVGVLGLGYSEPGGKFTDVQVEIITTFAQLASITLEHARLYDLSQKELAERKQAENALRASEYKLDTMLQTLMDGVVMVDLTGNIVYANHASKRILGIAKDEISNKYYQSQEWQQMDAHGNPYPVDQLPLSIALREQRSVDAIEHMFVAMDGEKKWVSVNAAPLFDANGELYGALAGFQDISERKQAERALKKSEAKFRAVVENSYDGILFCDADATITFRSPSYHRINGFSDEERIGHSGFETVHPDDMGAVRTSWSQIIQNPGANTQIEYRIRHKDGTWRWIQTNMQNLLDIPDIQEMVVTSRDITERRQAEDELRLQGQILNSMSESVILVSLENREIVYTNRSVRQMFGYQPEELIGQGIAILNPPGKISPEERTKNIEKSLTSDGYWQGELQNLTKDGKLIWCHSAVSVFEHPKYGKVGISIHGDITESRQAEENFQLSEQRFRTLVEQAPFGIQVFDPDGTLIQVNQAWEDLWGVKSGQVIGRFNALQDPQNRESEAFPYIERSFAGESVVLPEVLYDPAQSNMPGRRRWIRTHAYAVKDRDERIKNVVVINLDITDRKEVEEKLRESEEKFRSIFEQAPIGMALVDSLTGRFLQINPRYGEIVGRTSQEMLGVEINAITYPDDIGIDSNRLKSLVNGQLHSYSFDKRYVRPDQSLVWAHITIVSMWKDENDPKIHLTMVEDITARRQAEEELKESRDTMNNLIQQLPVGIQVFDASGLCTDVNKAHLEIFGVNREDVVGKYNIFEDPWARKMATRAAAEAALSGNMVTMDNLEFNFDFANPQFARTRGKKVLNVTIMPVFGVNRKVVNFVGLNTDITDRRQAELLQKSVYEIAHASTVADSLDELYADIHKILQGLVPTKNFYIALYDHDADLLSFPYFVDELDAVPAPAKPGRGLTEYVLRTRGTLLASREKLEELARTGEAESVGSSSIEWIGVPLISKDRAIGVMVIQSYDHSISFDARDVNVLEYVSTQVANAIERKESEAKLKEREADLNIAQRIAKLGNWSRDVNPESIWWSDEMYRLYRRDPSLGPFTYLEFLDHIHPDDRVKISQNEAKAIAEKRPFQNDYRIFDLDGGIRWLSSVGEPQYDDAGSLVKIFGTVQDVTEQKLAAEVLRESEQTTRLIIDTALDAVITMNSDGNITNWNEQAEKTFGWERSEVIGKNLVEIIIPEDQHDAHRRGMSHYIETGHGPILNRRIEVTGQRRDGSLFPVELAVHDLKVNGRTIFAGFLRDISERKQAEDELRTSQERLQGFFNQSLDGCFFSMFDDPVEWNDSVDKETVLDYVMTHQHITDVNDAMLEQYGARREDFIGRKPNEFFAHDLDQGREFNRQLMDNHHTEIYTEERREDGTPIWIEGDYVCMYDDRGRITGIFGIQRDITERKKYEETLLQFRSMMDHSNDAILMIDLETGMYIDCNLRACSMLGYEKADLNNVRIMDISNEISDLEAWHERVRIERISHGVTLETVYKRKDGSLFPVEVSAKTIEYKGREIMLDIVRDITERKEAEQAILKREADLAKAQIMAHMGSYSWNIQTGEYKWSDELRSIWGLADTDEPSFDFALSHIHPDDLDFVQNAGENARNRNKPFDIEYRIIRANGEVRYLHDRAEIQRDDHGNPIIMFGSVIDITERVEADAERNYLFQVLEKSLNEIYIFDAEDLKFIYLNECALKNLQRDLDNMRQITPVDIKPEYDEQDFRRIIQPLVRNELDVLVFETIHLRADGTVYPVEVHLQLVEFENTRVFLAVIYDITERKVAEASIKEAEARYQNLVERLPLVVYTAELGIDGKWTYVSPQIEDLLGYTPDDWISDENLWYQSIHPEDRDAGEKLEEQSYAMGVLFNSEYRIRTKNGREIWVRDSGQVVNTKNDSKPIVQGFMIDVTERKKADDAIRRHAHTTTVLYEASQQIRSQVDLDQVYREFHHAVQSLMPCEAMIISLLDEALQELEDVYLWDKGKRYLGERYPSSQHLTGWVIDSGNVLRINEWMDEHTRMTNTARFGDMKEDTKSVLAVPLFRSDGLCFGVVSPQSYEANAFTEEHEQLLVTLANQLSKAIETAQLFVELQKSNDELSEAYDATIEGWSRAMDLRDEETEGHTQRVTQLTVRVAKAMGFSEDELTHIRRGGLLHDIGKLGVPDRILFKTKELSKKEWEIMRKHPTFAYEMLAHVPYLSPALEIPYCHHEKWDGTGYPQGLKGAEIPLAARIFAVADVWDAVTSNRPYRKAWTKRKALKYIESESGTHFDPKVVKKFLSLMSHK